MKIFIICELFFIFCLIALKLFAFSNLSIKCQNDLIQRWSVNFSFEIINRLIITIVFLIFFQSLKFDSRSDSIIFFIIYVVFLDFLFYWRHRFYHRYFWRFHKAHHSDEGYDFTLSLRIHPFETLIQIIIFTAVSMILGVSQWQFLLAGQIFTVQALLSHFEYKIPNYKGIQFLRNVFVFPDWHRHHHDLTSYNCNFGFLLSFWDSIFKTNRSHLTNSNEPGKL